MGIKKIRTDRTYGWVRDRTRAVLTFARREPWTLILGGWGLALGGLLASFQGHPIVKPMPSPLAETFPVWVVWALLLSGILLMAAGFAKTTRVLPEGPEGWRPWAVLGIILVGAFFLRLYRYDQPPAAFWDDWADGIVWQNIMKDKDHFYWMFPTDGREPFLPYVMVGLMELIPDSVPDLVIKRLAGSLLDAVAIVLTFLAGRELGSPRAGLVAGALVAFSRPTLQLTLTGMRAFTLTLAVAFLVFASLRLFRRPTLASFLLWGVALAFGVHTYSSYRVFMMAAPFLVLVWVLATDGRKTSTPLAWIAGIGAILLLLGTYSGTLASTFPAFIVFQGSWDGLASRPVMMAAIFGVTMALASLSVWLSRPGRPGGKLGAWALSVVMASAMVYPISRSVGFTERLSGLSPFHQEGQVQSLPQFLVERCWWTLQAMFSRCHDRNDLQIAGDPFYDYFSQGALVLALAFLLARMDWKKAYLLCLGALGTVVYVLSNDFASTKLAASATPLYLLVGWAVASLGSLLPKGRASRWAGSLLGCLLMGYGAFGGWLQFQKLHGHWAVKCGVHTDTSLAKQVATYERDYKVYLAQADWFFGWNSQCVLNEGRRYYMMKGTNSVLEADADKAQDILVLVFGADLATQERIRKEFPDASWQKVPLNPYLAANDPNPELQLYRVFIPCRSLGWDPNSLFFLRKRGGPWLRRYYNPLYGWLLHGILREASVARFADPLPQDELNSKKFEQFNRARLLLSLGSFLAEAEGVYEFEFPYREALWLKIDGKTRVKRDSTDPLAEGRFQVRLTQGTHRLEVRTRFGDALILPDLRMRRKGDAAWRVL